MDAAGEVALITGASQGIRVSSIRVGPTASDPAPVASAGEAVLLIVSRPRTRQVPTVVVDPA
jgi:hypothetical protein